MKRGFVLGFGLVLIMSLFSFVVAEEHFGEDFSDNQDLNLCAERCKVDYLEEVDRSECIRKCKVNFEIRPIDPDFGRLLPDDLKEDPFDDDGLYEGYEDEELEKGAGSTPGSAFYFIDKFFDRFSDDLSVKEERIAEIKQLIEEGDIEGAKIALEGYMKLADELEHEINPDMREDAKRSASAIRNAMKDIRDQLPEGERGKFVSDIMSKEHSIATSAEIAGKIKDLCVQLAELDPVEYSRVCRSDDDSPDWRKKLDKDLTDEQRKEAKEFGKIMEKCFKSSGEDCDCLEIPFPDFAAACSKAAPLATACDIDRDEDACDALDELEMPELPDHLQDVFDALEGDINEAQYDMHMPRECEEAGVTNPNECRKIMIEFHSPEECKEALLTADVENEREGREVCDKIMMKLHAPECVEEGIEDPDECQDYMFSIDRRPQECQDNQIHDARDCKKFMEGDKAYMDLHGGPSPGSGGFGRDCGGIEDPTERLECYDGAISGIGKYEDNFEDMKNRERECADKCHSEGGAWDFSGGECKCRFFDHDYDKPDAWEGCGAVDCARGDHCEYGKCVPDDKSGEDYEAKCDDCESQCESRSGQRLRGTGCGDNGCECYYESSEPEYREGEGPGEPEDHGGESPSEEPSEEESSSDDSSESDNSDSGSSGEDDSSGNSGSESDNSDSGSSGEDDSSDNSGSESGDSTVASESSVGITGGVVSNAGGDGFLNYFF